jgi:hypothetical protein
VLWYLDVTRTTDDVREWWEATGGVAESYFDTSRPESRRDAMVVRGQEAGVTPR